MGRRARATAQGRTLPSDARWGSTGEEEAARGGALGVGFFRVAASAGRDAACHVRAYAWAV